MISGLFLVHPELWCPAFKEQMWGWEASCSGNLDFSMVSDSLSSTIPAVVSLRPYRTSG